MITSEEIGNVVVFAMLSETEREQISRVAGDVRLVEGDYAAHEGDERALFAVIEGRIEPVRIVDGVERVLGVRDPGDIFGEVPIVLGTVFPVGFRAAVPTRVMRLEARDYHALAAAVPDLSKEVGKLANYRMGGPRGLTALAAEQRPPRAIVVGSRGDATTTTLRHFLDRNQVSFTWLAENASDAEVVWGGSLPPRADWPVIRVVDGKTVVRPRLRRVAELLGLGTEPEHAQYDTVIVGAGPAGLAAAVYGASEGLATIVVEREAPGGQAGTSSRIENYLGFPSGVSGAELASRALSQARRLGAEILVTRSISRIDVATRQVHLDDGDVIQTKTIILACGVSWRQMTTPGFDRLVGKGIYYGAARSEASATHGLDIHVIGAGNSAAQAAMYFSTHAKTVTILCRGDDLTKSMSQYLIEQLKTRPNIHINSATRSPPATATAPSKHSKSTTTPPTKPRPSPPAAYSSSSAPTPKPTGSPPKSRSTNAASYSPAQTCAPPDTGPLTATPTSSKPASPASSPAATFATAPSNASPPPSAKAA